MPQHFIFAAPFFMDATLRFLRGAVKLPDTRVTLVSQDPAEKLPDDVRHALAGHWRIDDGLDPQQLADAARQLTRQFGGPVAYVAALEQLQVPLAQAREVLGIEGLSVDAARNFRDKSRMKDVLRANDIPCARHSQVGNREAAFSFAQKLGFPLVAKPSDGAGGKATYRLDSLHDLEQWLSKHPPDPHHPAQLEEFVRGTEHSFDSVFIDGKPVWHSISRYMPSPLDVLENAWIQWSVMLPRDIGGSEYDAIRDAGFAAVKALGLKTGLSHMEWFRFANGNIAINEVGARPPGAQICTLLSYAHDIDLYRAWPKLMANKEFPVPERCFATGAAYVRGQGRGRVRHIHGVGEIQGRYGDIVVEAKLPKSGQPPNDSYEGDGYIIIRHPDTELVQQALSDIVTTIRVELG